MKESVLKNKSFVLAIQSVTLYKQLINVNKEYVMSKQLLRSGTSVGANVREAQCASSIKDFIYKLSIALKECEETMYWLELLEATNYIDLPTKDELYGSCKEVAKMLTSSINTAKRKV